MQKSKKHIQRKYINITKQAQTVQTAQTEPKLHHITMDIENPRYRAVLLAFMSYINNINYNDTVIFSDAVLNKITPMNVSDWFLLKATGTVHPRDEHAPTLC